MRLQEPLHASLWGEERVLAQALVGGGVLGDKLERQVETAGAHELDERLDAGGDGTLLPAGDHGAVAAAQLGQLVLGQAGAESCLADEIGASDATILDHRLESVICGRYAAKLGRASNAKGALTWHALAQPEPPLPAS